MCVEPFCSHKIDYNPIWITFRNRSSVSQSIVHEIDNLFVRYITDRRYVSSGTTGTVLYLVMWQRTYRHVLNCTRAVNKNIRKYDRRLL